ncbi:MAG: hypothetical protein GYA12_05185 [Chloroflexi bacterium]|jgi:hypothetical protein|nr:hypothetical protein [Chloroflexota bacterium]BCY17253.1 hypothetical protein hrd7_11020 [Leptolinea sp. HRD-7]
MKMELNKDQQRYLSSTLFGYEQTLRFALQVLDSKNENGIIYSLLFDMNQTTKNDIRKVIEQELEHIATLVEKYNLRKKEINMARAVAARLSENWADLIDSTSSGLKNYGTLDVNKCEEYDRFIDEMAAKALYLAEIFSQDDRLENENTTE